MSATHTIASTDSRNSGECEYSDTMDAKHPTTANAYTSDSSVFAGVPSGGGPVFSEGAKRAIQSATLSAAQNDRFVCPVNTEIANTAAQTSAITCALCVSGLNSRKHSQMAAPKNTVATTANA